MIKVAWDRVARGRVPRAMGEYDRLGPEQFFAQHGFGLTCAREAPSVLPKAVA